MHFSRPPSSLYHTYGALFSNDDDGDGDNYDDDNDDVNNDDTFYNNKFITDDKHR